MPLNGALKPGESGQLYALLIYHNFLNNKILHEYYRKNFLPTFTCCPLGFLVCTGQVSPFQFYRRDGQGGEDEGFAQTDCPPQTPALWHVVTPGPPRDSHHLPAPSQASRRPFPLTSTISTHLPAPTTEPQERSSAEMPAAKACPQTVPPSWLSQSVSA